jgi:hypothetical protein
MERDVMTLTVDRFGVFGVEEDVHGGSTPPVVDCLVLDDYLGQQITEIKGSLEGVRSYVWLAEANYDKAERYCLAAVAASKNGLGGATEFFIDAIEDIFNFDRALRVSVIHKTRKPLRRNDIPKTFELLQFVGGGPVFQHRLVERTFKWSASLPSKAALKVAEVVSANPPDALWIAEYEPVSTMSAPIVYASYGSWEVGVARLK